ncbi:protein NEOXANTHIN-DEFICIENT 1 [Impatiens glandulifera]|uniref:protein NEOXANTHIN-DEFICIENT 1 n=1 Tax=Impatiens glandulifera TaxID=253017 RepID=UPI001FB0AC6A|nr:protein NEOXANTHIN-DEFICIENT 1 [Impatiens glandulifera]
MASKEGKSSLGYGKPPWIFRGSALYQLHLVKAEVARAFIPKELRLVEAFGYTLGGFFLASYDDSPVGRFDELVVIAGTVWNPPTSCAWASRVLVNSKEACVHGRKDVGLPSQVANFKKNIMAVPRKQSESKSSQFLNKMIGIATGDLGHPDNCMDIQIAETNVSSAKDMCSIRIGASSDLDPKKRIGPAIKLSLPSFSGHTPWNNHLLKYSCQIECRIRLAKSAKVTGPSVITPNIEEAEHHDKSSVIVDNSSDGEEDARKLSISVMLSKPVLALEFNCLTMQVEAPVVVSPSSPNNTNVRS